MNLHKWAEDQEKRLRGAYLTMAADADWMLVIIIHECLKGRLSEIKTLFKYSSGKSKGINDLSLDEKIEVCKILLKKYHPSVMAEHRGCFDTIDKLRDFRNKFAHCKIDTVFSSQDRKEITLHTILKNFKVKSEPYNVDFLWFEIFRYKDSLKEALNILTKVLNAQPLKPSV